MNNTADFIGDLTIELLPERELKSGSEPSFIFQSEATFEYEGGLKTLDTKHADNRASFNQNLKYWNKQVNLLSVNNYDNSYFERIVGMGKEAVPFIIEELEKGPTPLVHALDLIFPGVLEYDGYVSLKEVCDTWLSILKKTETD